MCDMTTDGSSPRQAAPAKPAPAKKAAAAPAKKVRRNPTTHMQAIDKRP
jgi:hypothetical protein